MQKSENWGIIINPNSGKRKAEKDREIIFDILNKKKIHFVHYDTHSKLHAIELTHKLINEGINKILVVGGDGTLNEVVNGIFSQDTTPTDQIILGLIPVGTGNDWGRLYNISTDYSRAIDTLINGKIISQDVGLATFNSGNGTQSRYFMNIAGMGFDAKVANKVNEDKINNKSGAILYIKNLLQILFKTSSIQYKITRDSHLMEKDVFSLCVGIGKYNGSGMMQLPNSIPDDGLFDITIIKKISKIDVILNVKNLYDGTFVKHPAIEMHTAKEMKIETIEPVQLELDGESVGFSPFTFRILERALNIIVP
jgi:YegS/Rv2252/BmrU family lipid kinase